MDLIKEVKQEILRLDPEAKVILFGSRARGDHREDSDRVFLVLLNQPLDASSLKALILERLYELELTPGEVISALIHAKADWEDRAITPIYQIIAEEGIRA